MNLTQQGPMIGGLNRKAEVTIITIEEINYDGEYIRLESYPIGLSITQILFAKWLRKKDPHSYFSGIIQGGQDETDWYYGELESKANIEKINRILKQYVEEKTTYIINYE